jgi:peptidoglycan biosynthesis protein MviN/MurJ (putative lipid II flippase)
MSKRVDQAPARISNSKVIPAPVRITALSAGALTTLLSFANVLIGFGYQAILAKYLGTGSLADDFQLTWAIVTTGSLVFLGLVNTVFVPRMRRVEVSKIPTGDVKSWLIIGIGFTILQLIFAHSNLVKSGHLATMLIVTAAVYPIVALGALAQALAYVRRQFALAASTGAVNGAAAFISLLIADVSALTLGASMLFGYVVQTVWSLALLRRRGKLFQPGMGIAGRSTLSMLAFGIFTRVQMVAERGTAHLLAPGAAAALGYGQKITQGLVMFATFGLAVTAMPSLADAVAGRNKSSVSSIVERLLISTLVLSAVVIVPFLPMAALITRLLFERGSFTPVATDTVTTIVYIGILWVMSGVLAAPIVNVLYAEHRYGAVLCCAGTSLAITIGTAYSISAISPILAVPIGGGLGGLCSLLVANGLIAPCEGKRPLSFVARRHSSLVFVCLGGILIVVALVTVLRMTDQAQLLLNVPFVLAAAGVPSLLVLIGLLAPHRHRATLRRMFGANA